MQSVSDWKKGITNTTQSSGGVVSVSDWQSSRPITSQQIEPVKQDLSFFDKLKGFGSSALQGVKQIPSYLSQAVQNPIITGQGAVATGVLKPLGFLTDISRYALKLENKGLNKLGIKTKEPRNVFSELATAMDDLNRSGNEQKAYDTGDFLGYLLPYSKVAKGTQLTLESLKLAPKVAKFIPAVSDAVGFLGTGQILYDEKNGTRVDQLRNDAIGLALFSGGGFLLKKSSPLVRNGLNKVLTNKAKSEVVTVMKPIISKLENGKTISGTDFNNAVTKANNVVINDTGKTTKELLLDKLNKEASKAVLTSKQIVRRNGLKGELQPTKVIKEKSIDNISDRVRRVSNVEISLIKKTTNGSQQQSRLKANGFQMSAIKRGLKREPTKIEFATTKKKLENNFVGKKVDVIGGGKGTVVGTAYGKIRVKLNNGDIKSFLKEEIKKSVFTTKNVLDDIEKKALSKIKGLEDTLGLPKYKNKKTSTQDNSATVKETIKNSYTKKQKEKPLEIVSTESTSGLAQSIKRKAIKDKMIFAFDKRFRELPKLERRVKVEDIKKTDEFVLNNPNGAMKVAMGERHAPAGMLPEDVLVSMTNYASATGNVEAMAKLANSSGLLQESRILGQRIQALSQLNPVVKNIKDVTSARQGRVKNFDKKKTIIVKELKKTKPEKDQLNWDKFITEISC